MTNLRTRADIEKTIIDRAQNDPAFREALLANPRQALEKFLNLRFTANITLEVHQESATAVHLVLPTKPELSDRDLEKIAGGDGSYWGVTTGSHYDNRQRTG